MHKLIVGLGNPGLKYKYTRHNLGFLVIDMLTKELGLKWKESTRFKAKFCARDDIAYLKPETFMNESGFSVAKCLDYYKITPQNLIVINDDLDLPFLTIKKQLAAGAAGHHGVEDIVNKIATDNFWRIRVGIGRPENKNLAISDWVLSNFSKAELDGIQKAYLQLKTLVFE